MKKVCFLCMLFLMLLGTARVKAQVTIGANQPPHPGAVLDLRSTKGLKLPTVDIIDAKVFQLSSDGSDAIGMMVYNTWDAITDGQGTGVYVWNGTKWMSILGSVAAVPVTEITVTPNTVTLTSGDTQQFTLNVQPSNATNQGISWSVSAGTGTGTIDRSGLFTAGQAGTVTVRATATDGSSIFGIAYVTVLAIPVSGISIDQTGPLSLTAGSTLQLTATVSPSNASNKNIIWSIYSGTAATVSSTGLVRGTGSGQVTVRATSQADNTKFSSVIAYVDMPDDPNTIIGDNGVYGVYCYPNNLGCWMTDNSKEGTAIQTTYPGHAPGERGYYYQWAQASSACPTGYHLPTESEWTNLITYLVSGNATAQEEQMWTGEKAMAGRHSTNLDMWVYWGDHVNFWSSSQPNQHVLFMFDRVSLPAVTSGIEFSVRCVKSN